MCAEKGEGMQGETPLFEHYTRVATKKDKKREREGIIRAFPQLIRNTFVIIFSKLPATMPCIHATFIQVDNKLEKRCFITVSGAVRHCMEELVLLKQSMPNSCRPFLVSIDVRKRIFSNIRRNVKGSSMLEINEK